MSVSSKPPQISILGIENSLAQELAGVLKANNCEVELSASARATKADMVFCPSQPDIFRKIARLNPARPIVVVSRLPEVSAWLDALEAGAADYCASPFESIQLRWLVDTHLSSRRTIAAA